MLMTRAEFYETCVDSLNAKEFERLFGVAPLDIWDFDYSFNKVHWNMNLEYAYNDACNNL